MATAQLNVVQPSPGSGDHKYLYELADKLFQSAAEQDSSPLLADAYQLAEQAWQQKSDYLPGLNLLTRIELKRGRIKSARYWVNEGLRLKSDSVSFLYSAGHVALAENDLPGAEHYFSAACKISRVATKAANYLAHIQLLQGHYLEAFQQYREMIKTQSQDEQVKEGLFTAAEQLSADFYSEELEQDLLRYFQLSDVDYSKLRSLSTTLLKHKFHLSESGCPLEMDNIANDELLLTSLKYFYFSDPLIERLLLTLRQSLLISSSVSLSISHNYLAFAQAIAHQTYLNESVWYETEQEELLISQLSQLAGRMLKISELGPEDLSPVLTLIFMYRPPQQCAFYADIEQDELNWPDSVKSIISISVSESKALRYNRQTMSSFGSSINSVSERVNKQYNENPYPRWSDIGYSQPTNYWSALKSLFPAAALNREPESKIQVLVAGCGTGRHALRLARYFNDMQVTAVDLSEQALAFAQLKSQQLDIHNIDFIHGDLLLAERLGQQFDVIECSGVLHHMEHPNRGLQAIGKLLKPGAVMKIALYSSLARQNIQALRTLIQNHMPETDSAMRLIREAMLQGSLEGDWSNIFNSSDFYSISACRDLLFHQQEHTFTTDEVQNLIDDAGLQWIGMIPQGESEQLAQGIINKAGHQLTLAEWGEIEQQNQDLFAAMYQFYVRKPILN